MAPLRLPLYQPPVFSIDNHPKTHAQFIRLKPKAQKVIKEECENCSHATKSRMHQIKIEDRYTDETEFLTAMMTRNERPMNIPPLHADLYSVTPADSTVPLDSGAAVRLYMTNKRLIILDTLASEKKRSPISPRISFLCPV